MFEQLAKVLTKALEEKYQELYVVLYDYDGDDDAFINIYSKNDINPMVTISNQKISTSSGSLYCLTPEHPEYFKEVDKIVQLAFNAR